MVAHGLMKATMFMALGGLRSTWRAAAGRFRRRCARGAMDGVAFAVGAASLLGTPLTIGFLAKWG
jgi:formate hydrogenlyase subunit 3/multisubunit Na+/H+ antiporter MnhD subunit